MVYSTGDKSRYLLDDPHTNPHEMLLNSIEVCFVGKPGDICWSTTINKTFGDIDSFLLFGQNAIFGLSVGFAKANVSFYHSLASVHSDEQCPVNTYCFTFLVFNIKIDCIHIDVSFTRKSIQCKCKINVAAIVKNGDFHSCQPENCLL